MPTHERRSSTHATHPSLGFLKSIPHGFTASSPGLRNDNRPPAPCARASLAPRRPGMQNLNTCTPSRLDPLPTPPYTHTLIVALSLAVCARKNVRTSAPRVNSGRNRAPELQAKKLAAWPTASQTIFYTPAERRPHFARRRHAVRHHAPRLASASFSFHFAGRI